MKTINHTNTLVYYDGVQVFAGQDAVGDHYVGAMIDTVGDADRYLVVAVASDLLHQFYAGDLDLRGCVTKWAKRAPSVLGVRVGWWLRWGHE